MKILILTTEEFDKADSLFFEGVGKKVVEGVEKVHSDGFDRPIFITCTESFYDVVTDIMKESGIQFDTKE